MSSGDVGADGWTCAAGPASKGGFANLAQALAKLVGASGRNGSNGSNGSNGVSGASTITGTGLSRVTGSVNFSVSAVPWFMEAIGANGGPDLLRLKFGAKWLRKKGGGVGVVFLLIPTGPPKAAKLRNQNLKVKKTANTYICLFFPTTASMVGSRFSRHSPSQNHPPTTDFTPTTSRQSMLVSCWIYVDFMMNICWFYGIVCWFYDELMLMLWWIYIGFMMNVCWLYDECMLVVWWLYVDFKNYVDFMMNVCWFIMNVCHWFYHGFMLISWWIYVDLMMNVCWLYDEFMFILWWIYVGFIMNLCWVYGEFMLVV